MTRDEARLDHLARECGPRVLAYLASRCASRDDACDVYAETLTTTWRRITDVPSDDGDALAWMFGVARRQLANHRRSEGRRSAATARLADYLMTQPQAASGSTDHVGEAVRALPADQSEIVQLVYWHGLTCEQAAAALDIRPAAARKRLQRARDVLRRAIVLTPS
ncbi:MAG: RNA polymerase sigma factor [Micrococcales bacterium]|nr:RNA polymerase sigma factor [Micrococcales bacterium]